MYAPAVDGFSTPSPLVRYREASPPDDLAEVVHCFWELRTLEPLPERFSYLALPDACVNLLFNVVDPTIAGITALHLQATTLDLGTSFHYAGVQFYPGGWQGDRAEIVDRFVGTSYRGTLPLVQTARRLVGLDFADMVPVLAEQVRWCMTHGHARASASTARILSNLDRIRSVADMAELLGLSTRQLQRTIRRLTGFAPHDLIKVLRLQQSFRRHYLDLYADQSHFINAFREAIGLTPVQYARRFSVRSVQDGPGFSA
ncbi:AraC family transcriptional regulator [Gemmatimonas sp.]|jgi:AraC-like DNA-binding protein|uniref:helix-turn-helix domain-containing protein n=1 Tax=Gemmatimonas sp. TaxID=1962908 RepID=UPI00333F5C66